MKMENVQIRIPDEEISEMEELIEILHMSKSEVARNALHEGIKVLKMEIAQKKYLSNEFTLCRAAEFADVSIQEMADYLQKRGIAFFKYSDRELKRDTKKAKKWLKS
jgi:predicted HTH domain antitoxin